MKTNLCLSSYYYATDSNNLTFQRFVLLASFKTAFHISFIQLQGIEMMEPLAFRENTKCFSSIHLTRILC